jgi:ankyrin repeat protein
MPQRPLPENPSLVNLRKQAKGLFRRVRAGDADALAEIRELHPRGAKALDGFSLTDAQLVTARGYGFPSWPKLKKHVDAVAPFLWSPAPESSSPSDQFLRLACLDYESWNLREGREAAQLLAAHPELAQENIYTAAATGDADAIRTFLARDPALVNAKGGPHRWEPLLYACYSRLDAPTLDAARVLLAAGADPNAGFLWHGNLPPFTALTGAFGGGEGGANNPPHPQSEALARLLLDAGADPNDEQTLYNRHFRPDDTHLQLLLSYGLGRDKGGPWFRRFERLSSPARLLAEELWNGARLNFFGRVKLLVEHGADVNTPGMRDGRTPYEAASRAGNNDIAAYLLQHGARKVALTSTERFAAACVNGDSAEAQALLEQDPRLLDALGLHGRITLVHRAVEANRPEGIRLMADLGFEVGAMTQHDGVGMSLATTPMHNAAWAGHLEIIKLLIELGADPNVRDPNYNSTPLGWAVYNQQQHVVEYLLPYADSEDAARFAAAPSGDA